MAAEGCTRSMEECRHLLHDLDITVTRICDFVCAHMGIDLGDKRTTHAQRKRAHAEVNAQVDRAAQGAARSGQVLRAGDMQIEQECNIAAEVGRAGQFMADSQFSRVTPGMVDAVFNGDGTGRHHNQHAYVDNAQFQRFTGSQVRS